MMHDGTKLVVLDSRPFDEYTRISIPSGINVPGAELVLRARDIAPSPDTTIVVNCAGRTRSIIGAQSLINAGVPNKVVALRNGTMGWHLAGLTCAGGRTDRFSQFSEQGLAWARQAAEDVARKYGVTRTDRAQVEQWRKDDTRTTYVFDVRDPDEYLAGHFPGAISAPGGQLVQATDIYAGVLGARIVVSDDNEVRALMTAAWLKQMGWREVHVLPEAGDEKGVPAGAFARHARGGRRRRRCENHRGRRRDGDRSFNQPALPARPYSRRLVRHPRPARPRAAQNPAPPDDRADIRRRRAGRARRRGGARADRDAGALAARRQCRLGRDRHPALDHREDGRRAARRVAQAL